jgi:hypothetical protein
MALRRLNNCAATGEERKKTKKAEENAISQDYCKQTIIYGNST